MRTRMNSANILNDSINAFFGSAGCLDSHMQKENQAKDETKHSEVSKCQQRPFVDRSKEFVQLDSS
jgi:hypothetical protein